MVNEMKLVLQPGDKIYTLFQYNEVIVKGSRDSFIIRIEKVEEKKNNSCHQHVRAMG